MAPMPNQPITCDNIELGRIYEVRVGKAKRPVYVEDRVQGHGLICRNLDTQRELFIPAAQVPKKVLGIIVSLSEWRLHNGD